MRNYDEKYLKQAIEFLKTVDHFYYDNEPLPRHLMNDIKAFIQSYFNYQHQKDEKIHGDL